MDPCHQEVDFVVGVEAPESLHLFLDDGGEFFDGAIVVGESE